MKFSGAGGFYLAPNTTSRIGISSSMQKESTINNIEKEEVTPFISASEMKTHLKVDMNNNN